MESKLNQIIKPLTNENNFNIEDMLDSDFEAIFNSLETDYIIHSKEATKANFQNEQTQLNDYYLVLSISVQNKNSKKIKCKKLSKKDLFSVPSLTLKSEIIEVLLTGIWADTTIYPNDKIFLSVNNFSQTDKCFLLTSSLSQIPNNSNHKNVVPYILSNYLIVEPETLLSPTQIKSGIRCYRNAFFQEEFKLCTYPDITRYTLIGNIVHGLFESLLSEFRPNPNEYMKEKLKSLLDESVYEIALINETYENILRECQAFIKSILTFYSNFITNKSYVDNNFRIVQYISSEKLYQSQTLGMKGIIDMVIEIQNTSGENIISPLEIKTGRHYTEMDQLQVWVYCLLLSEQFIENCSNGLLVYLKDGEFQNIKVKLLEMINIIVLRNNIVQFWKRFENGIPQTNDIESISLIPSLSQDGFQSFDCQKCFKREICEGHYNLYESSEIIGDEKIKNYFKNLYEIINTEQRYVNSSTDKKSKIIDVTDYTKCLITKIIDKKHSFFLTITPSEEETSANLLSNIVNLKEEFTIYLPEINKTTKGFLIDKNKELKILTLSILKFRIGKKIQDFLNTFEHKSEKQRISYLKFFELKSKFHFKVVRGNLLTLCTNPRKSPLVDNLQQFLIYNKQPTFNNEYSTQISLMKTIHEKYNTEFLSFSDEQKLAIISAIVCNQYILINTKDKNKLILLIVKLLYEKNNNILLCSHSNNSIDNILLYFKENNFSNFLRIGSNKKTVDNGLIENVLDTKKYNTVDEWKEFIKNTKIFATTTLSIGNSVFQNKEFDYCIIDESDSIFEGELIGPLLISKKFILLGDEGQVTLRSVPIEKHPVTLFNRLKQINKNSLIKC